MLDDMIFSLSNCLCIIEVPVASICNSKEMWTKLSKSSAFVLLHHVDVIQVWQSLKGIHRY